MDVDEPLTEINITSPTCIRELDAEFGIDIGGDYMAALEKRLSRQSGWRIVHKRAALGRAEDKVNRVTDQFGFLVTQQM